MRRHRRQQGKDVGATAVPVGAGRGCSRATPTPLRQPRPHRPARVAPRQARAYTRAVKGLDAAGSKHVYWQAQGGTSATPLRCAVRQSRPLRAATTVGRCSSHDSFTTKLRRGVFRVQNISLAMAGLTEGLYTTFSRFSATHSDIRARASLRRARHKMQHWTCASRGVHKRRSGAPAEAVCSPRATSGR